jgi:transglutaminase-like putative cysteine protease
MRPSVVEPHPSARLEKRGSQYISEATPPFSLPTTPPERPNSNAVTRKSALHLVLVPAEGWFVLLLLAVAAYVVIASIMAANWVDHTFILFWSAGVGLLAGFIVAKIRHIPQAVLHLAGCLVGHWLSIWLASVVAFHQPWTFLLQSLRTAITSGLAATTAPGADLVFLFYLSFLCFYLGYFGTWLIYRAHLPWLVALVYCSILLVNLNYVIKANYAAHHLPLLIFIFLVALILLIARIHLVTRLANWTSNGLQTDRTWLRMITWNFIQWAAIITLLSLSISWALPTRGETTAGTAFWDRLNNAWTDVAHGNFSWKDASSLISANQSSTNFFGNQLAITGSVNLPSGEVLYYTSTTAPQYLEGLTYDRFDGHTWFSSPPARQQSFLAGTHLPTDTAETHVTQARTNVVIVQPPTSQEHYIFAPAEPATFDVNTTVYINGTASTWMQQSPLAQGEHYQVTSNITTATSQDLSAIPLPQPGQSMYNNYITLLTQYLQIPTNLSPRVLSTAKQWTRGATNTDAAMTMLEAHLSDPTQFTYSVNNPPVPNNIDAVSWLLQTHQGYCTYYATAMTIMARLLGVPARIVNGFSYGHFDAQRKIWVVNGADAHSWVQIYFPTYGWINFDPTPGFGLHDSTHVTKTGPAPSAAPTRHPTRPSSAKSTPTKRSQHIGDRPSAAAAVPGTDSPPGLLLGLSLLVLLCSLCFLVFALYSYWWRSLYAGANIVSAMFWRTCRIAGWAGLPPQGWQTPFEYSNTLGQHFPREAAPMRRLTELFVRARWAAPNETSYVVEEDDLERLWPHLRTLLLRMMLLRIGKRKPRSR